MIKNLFRKKSINDILNDANNNEGNGHNQSLNKTLKVKDLTAFGIAAIVGAGIFSTIGKASADGGPAVIFLFLFTAMACGFAAFAYAEFASMVPISGSAYTYSYVAFGEVIAWIIGWSLIMEYAISNITVAISWSDYFTNLLSSIRIPSLGIHGIHLPNWITMDYLTASTGYQHALSLMHSGKQFIDLDPTTQLSYNAWTQSPQLGGLHLIADIPALVITFLITVLVYRGMRESRKASNAMVVVKLAVILLVIAVGIFYIDVENWTPFAPNGISGVLKSASAVFFAYIGFDAISTTAEECKDPQHDLPRGMMWSIIICTILYVAIALILTGIVNYSTLSVGDPLAFVFEQKQLKMMSGIVAISAVIALASVLLVYQMGQPRIWMSMSRDGLLPKAFSRIHPKYKTPSFATVITGFVVAVPSLFMNLTLVTDLAAIGTLFAFVLVCAGVLVLHNKPNVRYGKFRIPYVNSRYVIPVLFVSGVIFQLIYNGDNTRAFILNKPILNTPTHLITSLSAEEIKIVKQAVLQHEDVPVTNAAFLDLETRLSQMKPQQYQTFVDRLDIHPKKKYESGFSLFCHKIPLWIFLVSCIIISYFCFTKSLSLIPVLGLICCLYMMSEMGVSNWIGFGIWLVIGLLAYFSYGYRKSKLNTSQETYT